MGLGLGLGHSPASRVMNSTLRPCSRSLASAVHSGSMSMEVREADLGRASRIAAEVYPLKQPTSRHWRG